MTAKLTERLALAADVADNEMDGAEEWSALFREAQLRIEQLEGAVRIAYGQVQFHRRERKRAWDGDFVRVVCEAAINGEPEPGNDWREKLRAELDKTQVEHGVQKVTPGSGTDA